RNGWCMDITISKNGNTASVFHEAVGQPFEISLPSNRPDYYLVCDRLLKAATQHSFLIPSEDYETIAAGILSII
ncbi:MAG: hypothetical protein L3J16_06510, partial [Anaerolineales bacterium]|nr:hypothetical protein [Anaerolineales bacterium]